MSKEKKYMTSNNLSCNYYKIQFQGETLWGILGQDVPLGLWNL